MESVLEVVVPCSFPHRLLFSLQSIASWLGNIALIVDSGGQVVLEGSGPPHQCEMRVALDLLDLHDHLIEGSLLFMPNHLKMVVY